VNLGPGLWSRCQESVPRSLGFGSESRVTHLKEMPTWGPIFVSSVHIAIYFTTKKTLYTTVHLLLEEFKKLSSHR